MRFLLHRRRLRAPRLLFAALFALAALPLYAADDSGPLSLDAATQLAAARAPQVQAQLLRAQAAQDDAVRAGRLPDPKLTAGINNLTATGPEAFNAAADSMTMRSIGVMQEIPSGAKREAEKAVANAGVQLSDADIIKVRLAVKQATADAWVSLWAARRERSLLDDLREQAALAVKATKANLAGGAGDATDALSAKAAAVELENNIDAADADIAAAHAALQRWIGTRASEALADPPDFSDLRVPPAQLQAVDRQAPLLGWTAREDQAQARIDLAKAGKHPNWSVGLVYGDRIRLPDMIGIEVGVSLPLFPGNRQDRDISARYAERDAVHAEHEDARRAQREAVAAAIAEWQGDDKQVRRYRDELLPLAADRSRTALALYRGGASFQPWLEARRDEIDTRVAYAKALAAWGKAWAALAYLIPDSGSTVETP
jgi:outer membrane protein TolC